MSHLAHNGPMRWSRIACLGIVLGALLVPSAFAATRASLRVVDYAPLKVAGASFRSHETVRVTVTMNSRTWTSVTTASASGSFVVSWRRLRLDPCATPAVVSAYGAKSGEVKAKILQRDCAAP
jgi:heme A synthase